MNVDQDELQNSEGREGTLRSDGHAFDGESGGALPSFLPASSFTAGRDAVRRLLVVSYYYPPMGLSGVIRTAKFTRYLPQYGWHPTVLTVGDVGYYAHDESLLQEVLDAGVRIERTKTFDPLHLVRRRKTVKMPTTRNRRLLVGATHTFLQPDNKIGWKKHAVRRGIELAEEMKFDAVLATAPPFTSFLVGRELQEALGIPLVIDYRDPWLDNLDYFFATPLHRSYAAGLEENVLKNADGIVVVNRRIKEGLIARYPFLSHETVHILTSGYDANDFRAARSRPLPPSQRMRFTFSGIADAHQTPELFLRALSKLFAAKPALRGEIEVCFVGTIHDRFRKMAAKLGVSSALVTPGYVEHLDAICWLLSSDVLWLTTRSPAITPGKIHEYVGTGKPILSISPEGVMDRVMDEYGAGLCVRPDDEEGLVATIESLYEAWRLGRLPEGNAEMSERYEQQVVTEQLARVLAYSLKI